MRRRISTAILVLSIALAVALSSMASIMTAGADSPTQRIDELFRSVTRNNGPGCVVGVYREGKTLYERGYGMANLEYKLPLAANSALQIGSVTKQFTALAVLLLARDGKLKLDEDIHRYIPELPSFGTTVTIQQMLWHTSGLLDIYDLIDLRDFDDDSPLTQEKVLKIISRQRGLNFTPGTNFLYSNTNYLLLAIVIERMSGKRMDQFLKERIFGPLQMNNTVLQEDKRQLVPNRAYSYRRLQSGAYQNTFQIDEIVGSTGIFTTLQDTAKWNYELIHASVFGKKIIQELERSGTIAGNRRLEYGDGIVIGSNKGLRRLGHGGADMGYLAVLFAYPDYDFYGGILCNTREIEPWNVADEIARLYLGSYMTSEKTLPALSSNELAKYAGTYYSDQRGTTAQFAFNGTQLLLGGMPRFALRNLQGSKFQLADIPVYFEFYERSGEIELEQTMFGALGDKMVKIAAAKQPSQLSDYTGAFTNAEIPQSFAVEVVDGTLVMSDLAGRKGALKQKAEETFEWELNGLMVTFQREKGQIGRLTVTTDTKRTWNVPFFKSKGSNRGHLPDVRIQAISYFEQS